MARKKANGARKGAIVYLVLDRSGSMAPIHGATIEGVNHFIRETATADEAALFSMIQFDDHIKRHAQAVPILDVKPLDGSSYQIGGSTALLDAVGAAIYDVDKMEPRPEKTVIVIMTDGAENASTEYTRAAVKALIKKHEKEDKWQFLFLGANLDAFSEAGRIGMAAPAASSATWQQSNVGTQAAYYSASMSTSNYLGGVTRSATLTQDAYDQTLARLQGSGATDNTTPTVDNTTTGGKVDVTPTKPRHRTPR